MSKNKDAPWAVLIEGTNNRKHMTRNYGQTEDPPLVYIWGKNGGIYVNAENKGDRQVLVVKNAETHEVITTVELPAVKAAT